MYCDCEGYPYYGLAPHTHRVLPLDADMRVGSSYVMMTEELPKASWPMSFVEDPDCPGCGTYYCPDHTKAPDGDL